MVHESLGTLGVRVTALEQEARELRVLVDGQESWSHRKRLHTLENDRSATELVAQALSEFRDLRSSRWTRAREWGAFTLAAASIVFAWLHGG